MSDDLRPGTILGDRYRIDVLLGEGGMGRVYAAEHVLMRKRLAVKVLHRELTSVPDVVLRFEREAMAAAHIEHPNVAAATDFGKLPDGSVFLVLEYVQGKSLREEIAEGPMVVERALHIARQIGLALASAHELKIVHRDLKPENVMLVHKGGDPDFVKVLDFGIAKVPIGETEESVGKSITKAGMIFGTPEYMAPEQALGQNVDGRADLYALGVITYEMLSGVRPFTSHAEMGILGQQLANPPPSFAERAPGLAIPPQVEQLVLRLLAKEVDQRFQRAKEVVMTIDSLLGVSGSYRGSLITMSGGSSRESQATDPADAGSAGPRRSASGEAAGPVLAPPKLTNMGDFGWKIDVSALPLGENSGVVEPVASEPVPAAPEAIPEPPAGFDPIGPVANGVPAPQLST